VLLFMRGIDLRILQASPQRHVGFWPGSGVSDVLGQEENRGRAGSVSVRAKIRLLVGHLLPYGAVIPCSERDPAVVHRPPFPFFTRGQGQVPVFCRSAAGTVQKQNEKS